MNSLVRDVEKPVSSGMLEVTTPAACSRWLNHKRPGHNFCMQFSLAGLCDDSGSGSSGSSGSSSGGAGATINVMFVRNDWLQLSNHERLFDRMPWNRMRRAVSEADAIIVNRGAHYTPLHSFQAGMRAALRQLRIMAPNGLIIARSTPPGHLHCTQYTAPIDTPQDPASLPFNWGEMAEQNAVVREEAERVGGVYMDVFRMTALRPDGHKGLKVVGNRTVEDCLHYDSPGPVDTWSQMLMNMMVKLLAPQALRDNTEGSTRAYAS